MEDLQAQLDIQNAQLLALQTLLGTVLETSSSFSCGCTAELRDESYVLEMEYDEPVTDLRKKSTSLDDIMFVDEKGYGCEHWRGYDCTSAHPSLGYSRSGQHDIISKCPQACGAGISSWAPMPKVPNPTRY